MVPQAMTQCGDESAAIRRRLAVRGPLSRSRAFGRPEPESGGVHAEVAKHAGLMVTEPLQGDAGGAAMLQGLRQHGDAEVVELADVGEIDAERLPRGCACDGLLEAPRRGDVEHPFARDEALAFRRRL